MAYMLASLLLASVGVTEAQRIGTAIPEVHPKLLTQKCTTSGGCVTQGTSVVTDALSHPFHVVGDMSKSCNPNPRGSDEFLMDRTICPDAETCAKACEYEGVDYKSLGVSTEGSALTMRLFLPNEMGGYTRVSPRLYLLAEDDMNYEPIRLLNQEISFDVDMSTLGCGLNGALYLDEMDFSGSRSETNPAGAQYGTGYCDAQCYNKTMINGVVSTLALHFLFLTLLEKPTDEQLTPPKPNLNNSGACCHEMDIWEANSIATALTPHTCSKPGPFLCTGAECGRDASGVCDKSGCGLNPYKTVGPDFYGPGKTVDTKRPFTVVTQFWTDPKTKKLSDIRRIYVQDGRSISAASPEGEAAGGGANNTVTAEFCTSNKKEAFDRLGGMEAAGEALDRGMVLIFSIWNDLKTNMNWLDSGEAGPCGPDDGAPDKVLAANPNVAVTFSNIRWGDIGSTTPKAA
ncbi:glycoside hydrolase family 7 protein [Apiospora hydei]|uniref:Glucanase n=1 Tax=Apiospora hydei TaxID=1337664 RepID=A0ABR1VHE7_9PEZI